MAEENRPVQVESGVRAAIRSARVGRTGKAGRIDLDEDGPACCDHSVPGQQFGADEKLAALSPVESCANAQGFFNRYRREIADRQLACECWFLQSADHEPGHVIECSGDDASVSSTGCSFERAPEYDVGDHLVGFVPHLEVDARRIRLTADSSIFETTPVQHRPTREPPHERQTIACRRLVDQAGEFSGGLRHLRESLVPKVVR